MKIFNFIMCMVMVGCIDESKTPKSDPLVVERSTVSPVIDSLSDVFIEHKNGFNLSVQPLINNSDSLDGIIYWIKDYGPDGVQVNPLTGLVTWDIPNDMPSESFHIGIKVRSHSNSESFSFIVHAGVTQVLTVGEDGDYESLKEAMREQEPGGTIVVLDGEYSGQDNFVGFTLGGSPQQPPSGTPDAYTTIMAKHPGRAIFKEGAYVKLRGDYPVSYAAFKGFFVINGQMAAFGFGHSKADSNDRNHHIKFIRNGVWGNTEDSNKSSPFNAFRSDDILFENNYAFGGGRYKFASYQAENIVWRRNVARYDVGTYPNEPKGTYAPYTTKNVFLGNNIAVDSDHSEFVNQGELAGEFTTPTTSGDTTGKFQRNIQLNSAFMYGSASDQLSNGGGDSVVEHSDTVSWDVRPYSRYLLSWGSGWFDHMTMGKVRTEHFASEFFNGYHENTRGLTNSVLHDFQNGNMFYGFNQEDENEVGGRVFERYGVDTVNITEFDGAMEAYNSDMFNITEIHPLTEDGGLKYLIRIEPGTNLNGAAKDGGDLGATVMTFVGKSGALFGEAGYDVETNIPMWPFPMEDLIKEKFAQFTHTGPTYEGHYTSRAQTGTGTLSGGRGFAVEGQSLTNYIWGYLGNVVPPFNVTAIVKDDSVLLQWSHSAPIQQDDITGYKIYSVDDSTQAKELILEVSKDVRAVNLVTLQPNMMHYLAVTAQIGDDESGVGIPVSVRLD